MFHFGGGVCGCALHDHDGDVRAMAAWALDRLGSPETVPDLIAALYDPLFGVRSNAGWALVHIAQRNVPQVVVPDVVDVMVEGDNADARQMAYLVLRYIGCEEALEAINRYWRR
jgi:HEAT repeat protein